MTETCIALVPVKLGPHKIDSRGPFFHANNEKIVLVKDPRPLNHISKKLKTKKPIARTAWHVRNDFCRI